MRALLVAIAGTLAVVALLRFARRVAVADRLRAPAAGRVLFSDWLPGLGLLLVLDHGGGIMSLYGHNEQLYKKVGEQVNAGDVLSAVGDSGLEGRSGVYLEIRNGKQPVDPLNWLGKP